MKLKIDRKVLVTALGRVDVTPNRTTLPILGNVLIVANEKGLSLFSTDLAIGITETCSAEIEEVGEVTVPLKKLEDLLKATKSFEIVLETKDESTLIVKGDGKSTIKGIVASEFPPFPEKGKDIYLCEIDSNILKNALIKGSVASANEEAKVLLNSVYFDFGTCLTIVSTDGLRMSLETIDVLPTRIASAILPLKTVGKINSLSGSIKIYLSNGTMFFVSDTSLLFIKTITGEYIKYEQLIPNTINTKICFSKDDFISFGKQAELFANNKAVTINLLQDEGNIKLEMKSVGDEGESQGSFLVNKLSGDNQSFILHMGNTLEGVSVMDSKEILLEIDKPNSPVLFRDGDAFIYIMAVMVNT